MLFDSHCHPQFLAYDQDREEMLDRNFRENVSMIAVGTMYETSKNGVELARRFPGRMWSAVGVHPYHVTKNIADSMEAAEEPGGAVLDERFEALAREPEVVAIGESGLDFHYLSKKPPELHEEIKNAQRKNFLRHVALAKRVRKPLIIHARQSYGDVYEIMRHADFSEGAVMHFFQGTVEEVKRFLDLGCSISFAGPITFAKEYREVVQYVPLERMLAETDAPYATPEPHRGKRNEPAYVKFVVKKIAEVKELSFETVADATTHNAKTAFRID